MPRNGSGVFTPPGASFPAVASTLIESTKFNDTINDIATAISGSIAADGQTTVTANLPMGGYRHTGVANASARTDYAAAGQVQDGKLNWADGGGTADAITATYSPAVTALVDGQICFIRATAANATTTPTFSPNGLTARNIVKSGGGALVAGDIAGDGHELQLRYDLANTRWELMNPNVPIAASQAEMEAGTEAALRTVSPLRVAQAVASISPLEPLTINGNFEVNQRAATSVADDTYCVDRFYVLTESGSVTVAQLTDLEAGCPWGYRLTQPDASAKRMGLAQIIESKNCRQLRSVAATLVARIKPSFASAVRFAILEHTGTADTVTSDVVNNWASTSFTAGSFFIAGVNVLLEGSITPGAATFGDIEAYGTAGASMNNLIVFVWTDAQVAQSATLDFSRFDLVPGAIAMPRVLRLNERSLCNRYYYRARDTGSGQTAFGFGQVVSATACRIGVPFPVRMRSTPTLEQTGTATDYRVARGASNITCSAVPTLATTTGDDSAVVNLTVASGLTADQVILGFANSTAAYLGFPAEL